MINVIVTIKKQWDQLCVLLWSNFRAIWPQTLRNLLWQDQEIMRQSQRGSILIKCSSSGRLPLRSCI